MKKQILFSIVLLFLSASALMAKPEAFQNKTTTKSTFPEESTLSPEAAAISGVIVAPEDIDSDDYEAKRLQSPNHSASRSGMCNTIYLVYARAEDIYSMLIEVFESDINSGDITISQNAAANAIILRVSEPNNPIIDDVIDLINSVDFHNGQVLIDVLVVELSITNDELFNSEWKELIRNPGKSKRTLLDMSIDHGTIDAQNPISITEGFAAFITSANKMKLFLNALHKKGKVQVVSSPHIVTANHREAVFKIGEKLPLIDSVRPSDAGPITTYNIEEVGLELTVTPHINPAGEIDMEILQIVNAVMQDTYDAKSGTARMTTREAKTNLTVSNENTIVLGGFIEDKNERAEHRTPFLSDLPLVGKMFTSAKKTARKTELMVFITPKILTTKEDVQKITKTMISRTVEKEKTTNILEMREKVDSLLKENEEIIIDRRSRDWQYGLNTPEIDELVWQVPPKIVENELILPYKGSAPFGFGSSRRLIPAPVRTYLKPSEGIVFKKYFDVTDPEQYRRISLRVACENASAVYLNGILVDEDPMMKSKDGHDFTYWNRSRDDIPAALLVEGTNSIVVFLGSETEATDAYFDLMLTAHNKANNK